MQLTLTHERFLVRRDLRLWGRNVSFARDFLPFISMSSFAKQHALFFKALQLRFNLTVLEVQETEELIRMKTVSE